MEVRSLVPYSVFTTCEPQGAERFDAWRESISTLYEAQPIAAFGLEHFTATIAAHHLGDLVVGATEVAGYRYGRSKAYAARDGLDHFLLQFYLSGGIVGRCEGRDLAAGPGDVVLYDLAQPMRVWSPPSRTIAVVVARAAMERALPGTAKLHGKVLRAGTAFGGLLVDHLRSLNRRLPCLPQADADAVAQAGIHMIAACMHPDRKTLAEGRAALRGVTLDRIEHHIGQHLGARLLPEDLCRAFGISRRLLYELFELQGGVARVIQQRRLERALWLLADPVHQRLRIAEVAARCGFTSESHFSHAFRRAFGMTPRHARGTTALQHPPSQKYHNEVDYAAWIRSL